jgi:leucyl aminopeptidase
VTLELDEAAAAAEGGTKARAVFKGLVDASGTPDADAEVLAAQGCKGDVGETAVTPDGMGSVDFVVGLGPIEELDAEGCRRAGAALARAAASVASVAVELDGVARGALSREEVIGAFGEGAILGAYRFDGRKQQSESTPKLERLLLISPDGQAATQALQRARARAEAISLARDLVNTPAGDKTPTRFAELAREVGERAGLSVEIFDEGRIREMGLGGLLAVAKGSAEPPRLVRLEYVPPDPIATVALVGKGITFDSGGLSLKPLTAMFTMKEDCGGAAAVLGTMTACRAHDVRTKVVGIFPLTENMPGGHAQKPGDVFTARNGKTVEVLNTDAEGRLVLSDALSLAAEESPDAIVDVATLTAPIIVALGKRLAGLMGNDSRLIAAIEQAAAQAGEPVWHLPLPSAYRKLLDTDFADLKNIGPIGEGGALVAGLVLEEFVGSVPWAHLDIAGVAWSEEVRGYIQKGGTGFGVRTLIELLQRYEPIGEKADGDPRGKKVIR